MIPSVSTLLPRHSPLSCGIAAAALLASLLPAAAELITVSFTGTVTELDSNSGLDLSSEFSVGESINGFFTYDDSIASTGSSNQGVFPDAFRVFEVEVGDYHLSLGSGYSINVLETNNNNQNGPFQGDHIRSRNLRFRGDPVNLAQPGFLTLNLSDADSLVFPNHASTQSLTPTYDFSEFEIGSMVLGFNRTSEDFASQSSGFVRTSLSNFEVVTTPPTTRAMFDTVDLEFTDYLSEGGLLTSTASILANSPLSSAYADFSSLGDDEFQMTWSAPINKIIEIEPPAGFTIDAFRFFMETNTSFLVPIDVTLPMTLEVESAGGAPLPAAAGSLELLGGANTSVRATVTIEGLVPGEIYRIKSLTAKGVVPASYDKIIDDVIVQVSVIGTASIDDASAAPDPGQWVRLVDSSALPTDFEITAPEYRAAIIGDTIHLPMEVWLDPAVEISDWDLAIQPMTGLTVSNLTVLETQAAATTDTPPGVREGSGSEVTELSITPLGGIVSSVSLSGSGTTTLGATGAPHKILRFTLSGPAPEYGMRESWAVGFVDGLQGSGTPVNNLLSESAGSYKPYTKPLVFDVFGTIPATLDRSGSDFVLEWSSIGDGERYDVYSFTEFSPDSVTLWQEDIPRVAESTSIIFPVPGDSKRFFTVVPAPPTGGGP